MEKCTRVWYSVTFYLLFVCLQAYANHHSGNGDLYNGLEHRARHERHREVMLATSENTGVVLPDGGIRCYQCNSEYDPRCGDPFNPYSLGIVNCSLRQPLEHLDNQVATLCRKTIQKVYGKIRVVRGCGYVTDPRDDGECMKRSGTHDVFALYCSCTKSLCNGAPPGIQSTSGVIAFFTAALLTYLRVPS